MGSLINAVSLGRIGIGLAFNDSVLRAFIRVIKYLENLKSVRENFFDTTNVLVITKEQFSTLLNEK